MADGSPPMEAVLADVFYFEGDKIHRPETYPMFKTPPPAMPI